MLRIVAFAVAAMVLAAGSPTDAHARSAPEGFFGVMVDGVLVTRDDASFAHELALMRETGVEVIRPVVYWADLQPERGEPILFGSLDRVIAEAARNDLRVLPVVLRAPAWARVEPGNFASPPKDPAAFAAFLTALVERYGPGGAFWAAHPEVPERPQRDWQVWNEPNLDRYWSSPEPFAEDFVALQRVAHRAIKAADPGANVILAGFGNDSWRALRAAYRAGLDGRFFDTAAVHPFSGRVRNVLKIVRLNRRVLRRHGDGGKPMVVSEITWPSAKGTRATTTTGFETTPRGQARKLRAAYRAFLRLREPLRIRSVVWSTWLTRDCCSRNSFEWSGLRRLDPANPEGEPIDKPAYEAYRRMARR